MSNLKQLLDGVEVEWKSLGEIGHFIRGSGLVKKDLREQGVSAIHYGQIHTHYGLSASESLSFVSAKAAKTLKKAQKDDVIIVTTSEILEEVCKPFVWLGEDDVCVSGETYIFKHKQNPKFIAYCLQTSGFSRYKKKIYTGTKVYRVHKNDLEKFKIPLPSIEVQKDIVRYLDAFSQRTEQIIEVLNNEIEIRKKQHAYYREKVLTFEDEHVEMKTLGEIGQARMCKRILKQQTLDVGEVPFYKIGTFGKQADAFISLDVFNEYRSKYPYPKKGDVLISASGTIGKTVIFDGKHAYFQDSNIVWIENDEQEVLNTYLFHFYKIARWDITAGSTVPRLYHSNLKRTKISVPTLDVQHKAVNILDHLEILFSSIVEELTNEINVRRKQLAYYRNKLLGCLKTLA